MNKTEEVENQLNRIKEILEEVYCRYYRYEDNSSDLVYGLDKLIIYNKSSEKTNEEIISSNAYLTLSDNDYKIIARLECNYKPNTDSLHLNHNDIDEYCKSKYDVSVDNINKSYDDILEEYIEDNKEDIANRNYQINVETIKEIIQKELEELKEWLID